MKPGRILGPALVAAACLIARDPASGQVLMRGASTEALVNALASPGPAHSPRSPPGTRSLRIERRQVDLEVNFDFDSARLQTDGELQLERLSRAINHERLRAAVFVIEGHTDMAGSALYNLELSEKRAETVRRFLEERGVDSVRLTAYGQGFAELLNKDDPMAPENRRVRVIAIH